MGIGFRFGPPRGDRRVHDGWFGDRELSEDQFRELMRHVEAWGGELGHVTSDRGWIAGDCEAFTVRRDGGYLDKPTLRDELECERLTSLMVQIADHAGWIVTGDEGLVAGGVLRCETCGARGFPYRCAAGHPRAALRLDVHSSPPMEIETPPSPLDAIRDASTSSALRRALDAHEGELPMNDPHLVLALLLSDDTHLVSRALDVIESGGDFPATLLDVRLRRLAMLSDDPSIAERAKSLRR